MGELIVIAFLVLALIAYVITGGADFGVGILELAERPERRDELRAVGERAIAPVWEANHIWIIVALVIVFVGFPQVHVQMTTVLHIPLLLMLVGIILRGTAFTFRYYDIGEGEGRGPWTTFFRGGSVMVPMMFGHMVAAMSRGRFSAEPTSVYDAYIHPWVGWFPFATGLFVTALFAWIAAVFLVGEERAERKAPAAARARRWTVLLVPLSGAVTLTAWLEGVPWLVDALRSPLLYGVAILALGSTLVLWRLLDSERLWTVRALAGAVVVSVLAGYWGAVYPTAVQLEGGASIGWHEAAAPSATMNALAVTLIAASLLILPGLAWLYRLFKTPNPEDRGGPVQPS